MVIDQRFYILTSEAPSS